MHTPTLHVSNNSFNNFIHRGLGLQDTNNYRIHNNNNNHIIKQYCSLKLLTNYIFSGAMLAIDHLSMNLARFGDCFNSNGIQ